MKAVLLPLLAALVLSSCASGRIRENCQEHNWQKRGMDLARQGKTIDQDFFTKKCEANEGYVNYAELDRGFKAAREDVCDPKKALAAGKKGQNFKFPICRDHNYEKMQAAFNRGLDSFCRPKNARALGASGAKYNGVCPPSSEDLFMTNYSEGRKQFLKNQIQSKRTLLENTNSELAKKQATKQRLLGRLNRYDSRDVRSELDTVNWSISSLTADKAKLEYELQQAKESLGKL